MAWKPRFQTGTLSTKDGAAQVLARYRDEERGRIIYERLPREIAINTTPSLPEIEHADLADFTPDPRFPPFAEARPHPAREVTPLKRILN